MREIGLYNGIIASDGKIDSHYFDEIMNQVYGFRRSEFLYIIADDNILGVDNNEVL